MTDLTTTRPQPVAHRHPVEQDDAEPAAGSSALAVLARFVLDRSREDVVRAELADGGPVVQEIAHARARQEVAETWLRLDGGTSTARARLDELGRVLCLLAAPHRDHPDFAALERRWPAVASEHPLW
ncbi:hypothetical protein [Modestobacter sp. Leaf380]|uniref:hypothetical protein n=1 Tax=Modestobacter sp. Leaf380 TaxID=1736356 RepID=UPI0006F8033F|nr:hypothetical protein [Modestobacter sp. Leaf380]KQS65852.1 hypothetical protein ASG41_14905 [Modestobacter sp. Leaf380]